MTMNRDLACTFEVPFPGESNTMLVEGKPFGLRVVQHGPDSVVAYLTTHEGITVSGAMSEVTDEEGTQ